MKKILLFILLLSVTTIAMSQVKVAQSGNVGIGLNSPSNKFCVNISGSNKMHFVSWTNTYIDQSGENGGTCFYPQNTWYL
jgi:hypothetical protein